MTMIQKTAEYCEPYKVLHPDRYNRLWVTVLLDVTGMPAGTPHFFGTKEEAEKWIESHSAKEK